MQEKKTFLGRSVKLNGQYSYNVSCELNNNNKLAADSH